MQRYMTESLLLAQLALVLLILHGAHHTLRLPRDRAQIMLLHRFIISLLESYERSAFSSNESNPDTLMP